MSSSLWVDGSGRVSVGQRWSRSLPGRTVRLQVAGLKLSPLWPKKDTAYCLVGEQPNRRLREVSCQTLCRLYRLEPEPDSGPSSDSALLSVLTSSAPD